MNQLADLIQYFVEHCPGVGPTALVLYLYRADLECRRYLGRPVADLEFILWNDGPLDSRIYAQLDRLCENGTVQLVETANGNGRNGCLLRAAAVTAFPPEEALILGHIVEDWRDKPLDELRDQIRQTTPMADALRRNQPGSRLHMELVDGEERIPGLELERMLHALEQLDRGEGLTFEQVRARAGAAHSQTI
ncbi:MAG: hypothetical protein JNM56_39780 [Planctomycetia bacterium]|nr:hypothetical protein [Planctomycetia bacterium]